ncbi:hypothetical protein L0668_06640 [Paraglaciecola aquimarina]|uniref:PEP-CTERM sorting domain-containing protein n=1 Tax=Paraglaciecola algarum TaxID=3050085 RepID=A0ABS9D4C7_9ALTE|nr:hypothetical protein [Paraglaciecola sp. G1-23]MCF2947776.1 hypothetical protein [Paraglaciecola sp. G1-23]
MPKFIKILIASCLIVSFVTEARLIRGLGRGGITVSFGTQDLLVPISEINEFGMLNWDYYDNPGAVPYDSVYVPPGYPMVMAVPNFCFVELVPGQPFDDEPCYWQFSEGDQLEFIGSTVVHFSLAIQDISWQIFEADDNPYVDTPLFEFNNSFSAIEDTGDRAQNRELYMNAPMPADLALGEYQIQISVVQAAPLGYTFYGADTSYTDEACFGDPGNIICSRLGGVSGDTFIRSGIERFVVVTEPSILLIFLTSCLIMIRRTKQK